MTLSANDLAAAVLYQNTVQNTLYRILNDVWNESSVDGANDNKWSYSDPKGITYRSPLINGAFRYRYGFDFRREDDDWNVTRLGLPSAFFCRLVGECRGELGGSCIVDKASQCLALGERRKALQCETDQEIEGPRNLVGWRVS